MSDSSYVVVLTTCAGGKEAGRITDELLEKRLAACVQASVIKSVYRWQGKIEEAREVRLTIKARAADFGKIEKLIRASHSYENPEIVAVPIVAGSQAYFDWISNETSREIE